jgi:hypothetical protein
MERNAKTGETVERMGSWMNKGTSFGVRSSIAND